MAKIHLFEPRRLSEAERLAGLRVTSISTLARPDQWRHTLPHAEAGPVLIWISRGQGRLSWEARTRGYGAATLLCLPAGTPFWIEPGPGTECVLARMPELFEAPMPAAPLRLRLSDISVQGELAGLLDRLSRAGDLSDPAQGRAALGRIILVSALIEREKHREEAEKQTGASKLARRFARAVEENLTSGATIETLAHGLGVTPAHLTRTIKSTCTQSALDYRNARLMHEARRRLIETDDTAATIGATLGFASPAYFSRAFTASAGQPPARFRRAARQVVSGVAKQPAPMGIGQR